MIKEKIVINEHIQGDPLSEENLDKTLKTVNEIRLSLPNKSIWLYTGYEWEQIFTDGVYLTKDCFGWKRRKIVKQCDILVDGRYVDAQKDITLKFRGSSNQRVISIQESLKQNKIILYEYTKGGDKHF